MDITEELPTVISFCSGYAGIERGLDLAGIRHRVIAYCEIESYAIANLVSKMESGQLDSAPIYTNLKTFPSELFRGAVDIITGGYPCQPFSAAGKRLGEKDPRHLWPYIREHINTIQPARVFLENVEGHISMGLSSVISDLEEDSYGATWGIFSAREVGAPHQRKRVYIMADCNGVRCDWGALSNGDSERPMEVEALEGSEQPLVRSEVEGCSGDSGGDVGYSQHDGSLATTERGSTEDGCADRVDRIRLLGNGVVPQTAAKAWQVLSSRLEGL